MKGSRLFKVISIMLSFMLIFSLFPAQTLADSGPFTVIFKDWDGTVLKEQTVDKNADATAPAAPTRAGYVFDHWDKDFTRVRENLVVTAIYLPAFTVTFKDWDGTVLKTQSVAQNGDATAPTTPTRTGFVFDHWDNDYTNVQADVITTAVYVPESPTTPPPSSGNSITVNFFTKLGESLIQSYTISGLTSEQILHYQEMSNAALINALNSDFGMNFLGVSSFSNGDFTHNGSSSISLSDGSIHFIVDAWYKDSKPTTYTVRYLSSSGISVHADKTVDGYVGDEVTETALDITGYILSSSSTSPQSIILEETDNLITFVYDPIVYTITYNNLGTGGTNDNPAQYTIETPTFTLNEPTRPNYTFAGWDPTDTIIEQGTTGDLSFTASWTAISYSITYILNGGVNDSHNPESYTVESEDITLANPTKSGYNFLGWDPEGFIASGSEGDKTFTATWSNAIVYSITYDLDGGSVAGTNPSTYTIESADITLINPTKDGYTFLGWDPTGFIAHGSTGDKHFTATWSEAIAYSITYDLGGGTVAGINPSTYTIESADITLINPTKDGYTFLGWDPTGFIAHGSTGDKHFTALWSNPIRYSITYTMNGGTNSQQNPSSYTVNSATITLRDPWRLGYNFAGWTPTNSIPSGSTGNKAFTATWTAKTYTIHYYMNGGTNAPSNPATYTPDTPTIHLANPTRAGYDFWFWFPLNTIPQGSVGDRYVWAIWKAPTNYSITYYLNGGTNNPANPSTYNVESSTINLGDPTRAGYTFAAWSPTNSIPAGSTGNKEFTASWTPITYSITYNLAGGVNAGSNPATYTIETPTFSLSDPTRDYYTFAGWTPSDTTIEQGSTGDLSFTASWTPITYNIAYNLAGGVNNAANPLTYTVETPTFTLADPTRLGYTFAGWDPADTTIELGSHGDLTFTAAWTPIVYPITYVMNGGANAAANPATYTIESPAITLAAPTRAGYAFLGWTPVGGIPAGSTGPRVFTANWSAPLVYPITYVLNGGTNAAGNPDSYTVVSGLITLGDATRAGYDFLGWTPTDNIPAGSTGARTFTATWSAAHEHTVTYFVTGGTNTGLDGATPYRVYNNVAYGSVVPVPANPSQDQYTFDGWTTAIPVNMPDQDVVIYGSMTQMPALQEIITNERTPLAGPTWSLLNLIMTALTVISIGTIFSIFQKKRENKSTRKNTAFSLSTLLPAAGVIIVFIMTQVLTGTMVLTDRWSYLFAGLTLVQAVVVTLALTGKPKKV